MNRDSSTSDVCKSPLAESPIARSKINRISHITENPEHYPISNNRAGKKMNTVPKEEAKTGTNSKNSTTPKFVETRESSQVMEKENQNNKSSNFPLRKSIGLNESMRKRNDSNAKNKVIPKVPKPSLKIKNKKPTLISSAYIWGSGKDGRCGNGKETGEKIPTLIDVDKFSHIVCGYHHTVAISITGQVMSWGRGAFGQLGHGNVSNYAVPSAIASLSKVQVSMVACGWQHTMALTVDGRVFSWVFGVVKLLGIWRRWPIGSWRWK